MEPIKSCCCPYFLTKLETQHSPSYSTIGFHPNVNPNLFCYNQTSHRLGDIKDKVQNQMAFPLQYKQLEKSCAFYHQWFSFWQLNTASYYWRSFRTFFSTDLKRKKASPWSNLILVSLTYAMNPKAFSWLLKGKKKRTFFWTILDIHPRDPWPLHLFCSMLSPST